MRTWYPVEVPKFYNPVITLLLPLAEKNQSHGMKTVGQLRREKGIQRQVNEDHLYKVFQSYCKYKNLNMCLDGFVKGCNIFSSCNNVLLDPGNRRGVTTIPGLELPSNSQIGIVYLKKN